MVDPHKHPGPRFNAKTHILGLNPGGDPYKRPDETICRHTGEVLNDKPARWSEYSCESWPVNKKYRPPGEGGIQPSVVHLLQKLGYDPRDVPASNVIFTRTRDAEHLNNKETLSIACWPLHREVIRYIKPKLILCLGRDAEDMLRKKTSANKKSDSLLRRHKRGGYLIEVFQNGRGCRLVSLGHPSRIKWSKEELADISGVVGQALVKTDVRWSSVDVHRAGTEQQHQPSSSSEPMTGIFPHIVA